MSDVVAVVCGCGSYLRECSQGFGRLAVKTKTDGSSLCEADLHVHQLLSASLSKIMPGVPVLSEEARSGFMVSTSALVTLLAS